jgi:hypothetical protein
VLTGCSDGAVEIRSPDVSRADRAACTRFLDALPETLADRQRREVSPSGALGAAWGDPAITLTCGVGVPDTFDRFASCEVANGVGWFVPPGQIDDRSGDVALTAVGYRPRVQVVVPSEYRPAGPAAVIAQLAEPVKRGLELVKPCH